MFASHFGVGLPLAPSNANVLLPTGKERVVSQEQLNYVASM
jgi:hypothetical protein